MEEKRVRLDGNPVGPPNSHRPQYKFPLIPRNRERKGEEMYCKWGTMAASLLDKYSVSLTPFYKPVVSKPGGWDTYDLHAVYKTPTSATYVYCNLDF